MPEQPQLKDFQAHVMTMEAERGFDHEGPVEKCLLLGEETGELFKAVPTSEGMVVDKPGGEIVDELGGILMYVCAIANRYDIDLEIAFRSEERRNAERTW